MHWMLGDLIVDESTYKPGKEVYLESHGSEEAPLGWQIFQVFDSAIRQILKYIGVPERRLGPELDRIKHVPPSVYRSANSWRLPEPRGWRRSAAYIFTDSVSDEQSRPIYSSRVGRATLKSKGGAGLVDPTGTVPVGIKGSASIESEILFAADPHLSVSVLTGEALATYMARNLEDVFLRGEVSDVAGRIELKLDELDVIMRESYTPPRDWAAEPSTTSVSGDDGDVARLAVDFETPSPGDGYYAIAYESAEADEYSETTEVWAVSVDVDLNVSILRDVSNIALRIPVFA